MVYRRAGKRDTKGRRELKKIHERHPGLKVDVHSFSVERERKKTAPRNKTFKQSVVAFFREKIRRKLAKNRAT